MPPFMPPVAPVMALELALMALMIGVLRQAVPRMPVWCLLALALAVGRIVNASLFYVAARILELPAGFVAGISLLSGWPGLLLMLAVIPGLVHATGHAQYHIHDPGAPMTNPLCPDPRQPFFGQYRRRLGRLARPARAQRATGRFL